MKRTTAPPPGATTEPRPRIPAIDRTPTDKVPHLVATARRPATTAQTPLDTAAGAR